MSWQPAPHLYGLDDKVPYTMEGHSWKLYRGLPWQRCQWCGLVRFRNELTAKAIALGCNHKLHPQWRSFVKQLGGLR